MAWVTPSNVATGDVLTASKWNQDVVENWNAIGGEWTAYTPTFTNLTLGNGTQDFRYMNAGKLYLVRFKIDWGSTTSASGGPEWTLPNGVSLTSDHVGTSALGSGFMLDASGPAYMALIAPGNGVLSRARFAVFTVSGSNITFGGASATSPATWTTGDRFTGQFMFEAA